MGPIAPWMQLLGGLGNFGGGIFNAVNAFKNNKKAAGYDRAALAQLRALENYTMDDLYKKLSFGNGEDDLRKYKIGEELKMRLLGNTNYDRLANDHRINSMTGQNFNAIRQLRDEGMRDVDRNQQAQILQSQRDQTKALQNTIMRRAVERGVDPTKANLNARLMAAQNIAETGNRQAMQLASNAAQRRMQGLQMGENAVARDYARKAQIAGARDRFAMANNQTSNDQRLRNWGRTNSINDRNTGFHNQIVNRNTNQYLGARRGVIDSRNNKRNQLSNYYGNAAAGLRGQAGRQNSIAGQMMGNAAYSIGTSADALYNHYRQNPPAMQPAPAMYPPKPEWKPPKELARFY